MLMMLGNHGVIQQAKRGRAHPGTLTTMVHASQTRYRVEELVAALSLDRSQNKYLQRHRHEGTEIYFSSARFLISGGGTWEDNQKSSWPSSTVTDLYGCALPTSVILTDSPDDDIRTMIRFDGEKDPINRSNICVGPNFACGFEPHLPDNLPLRPECIISTDPSSPVYKTGLTDDPNWRFIDFDTCVHAEVWAAVYIAPCKGASCIIENSQAKTVQSTWGFAEVIDSNRDQIGFQTFVQSVLNNNAGRTFDLATKNIYSTTTGFDLTFAILPSAKDRVHVPRLIDISGYSRVSSANLDTWRSANGALFPTQVVAGSRQIISQDANAACIVIDNPGLKRRLILDFHDKLHPWSRQYSLPIECKCGPNGREGVCPEQ